MSKRWCGNVNSTSERNYQTFNKLQAKSIFSRHVGGQVACSKRSDSGERCGVGKAMKSRGALQHVGQYKSCYFVDK